MKKIKVKNIILVLLAVICVCVLLYSLYQGLIIYIPQKQEQQRFDELRQIVEQESKEKSDSTQPSEAETRSGSDKEETNSAFIDLATINDNYKGWLKIEDTVIDYPVMKSSEDDPEYYLHRDFDTNYSFSGTPFIGAGADENADAFVIYAHNMNNGTIALGSENEFKYNERAGKLSDEEYKAFVNDIKDASVMFTGECPDKKTQILMLSTCSYHAENGRFVVAAYRV